MTKTREQGLLDDAGRLYVLCRELDQMRAELDALEGRIQAQERKVADARRIFEATAARHAKRPGRTVGEEDELPVAPGKLPHRVLSRMQRTPTRIHTAAELAEDLHIEDVQQVRTALARLLGKGLIRRVGEKGQFTL